MTTIGIESETTIDVEEERRERQKKNIELLSGCCHP